MRKDSGNYTSEEDWHISIFLLGAKPRGKIEKLPSSPKMCNFHYPFEIKAWYICFISLLYKLKHTQRFGGTDLLCNKGATTYHSALTEWHAQAFGVRPAAAAATRRNLPNLDYKVSRNSILQSLCKIHGKLPHQGCHHLACVTHSRRAWSQAAMFVYKKISDPKRDLDRVPGLTGDLRRYCRRQVYELSVYKCMSRTAVCLQLRCALKLKQILLCIGEHAQVVPRRKIT